MATQSRLEMGSLSTWLSQNCSHQRGHILGGWALLLLSLLPYTSVGSCAAAPAQHNKPDGKNTEAKKANGWILEQRSRIDGLHKLYVTAQAIKSVNIAMGCSFISRAPDWQVTIVNDRSRSYFVTSLDAMNGEPAVALYAPHRVDLEKGNWNKGVACTIKIAGKAIKSRRFDMNSTRAVQPTVTNKYEAPYARGVWRAAFWEASEIELPEQESALLRRVYIYPDMRGLPLQMLWLDLQRDRKDALQTTKLEKAVIADSIFEVPANYKRADKELNIYRDERSNEAMKGFAEWLGVDEGKPQHAAAPPSAKPAGERWHLR